MERGNVQHHDDESLRAGQLLQNRADLLPAEHHWQSFRRARAHDRWNRRDLDREDVRVQKEQRAEGLILRRRTDPTVNSQPREELRTCRWAENACEALPIVTRLGFHG